MDRKLDLNPEEMEQVIIEMSQELQALSLAYRDLQTKYLQLRENSTPNKEKLKRPVYKNNIIPKEEWYLACKKLGMKLEVPQPKEEVKETKTLKERTNPKNLTSKDLDKIFSDLTKK